MTRKQPINPTIFMAEQLSMCLGKIAATEKLLTDNNNSILCFNSHLDDFDFLIDDLTTNIDKLNTNLNDNNERLRVLETKINGLDIRLEGVDSRLQWAEDSIFSLQNQQKLFSDVLERVDNNIETAGNDIKEIYDQLAELTSSKRTLLAKPG